MTWLSNPAFISLVFVFCASVYGLISAFRNLR